MTTWKKDCQLVIYRSIKFIGTINSSIDNHIAKKVVLLVKRFYTVFVYSIAIVIRWCVFDYFCFYYTTTDSSLPMRLIAITCFAKSNYLIFILHTSLKSMVANSLNSVLIITTELVYVMARRVTQRILWQKLYIVQHYTEFSQSRYMYLSSVNDSYEGADAWDKYWSITIRYAGTLDVYCWTQSALRYTMLLISWLKHYSPLLYIAHQLFVFIMLIRHF